MLVNVMKSNRWLTLSVACCVLVFVVLGSISIETTKAGESQYSEFQVVFPTPDLELLHMAPILTATHPNTYTPPLEMQYLPSGGNALQETQRPEKPSASPDLDVRFIERTLAYAYNERQKWPEPGETVTFTAHIANFGDASSGAFAYSWAIDGIVLDQSTHPGLAVDEADRLEFSWVWEYGAHTIQLSLDTESAIAEISETNNTVTDRTDALSLGIWVEQSFYDFFNDNVFSAGWGGNSFDDWIQRHVDIFGLWTKGLDQV